MGSIEVQDVSTLLSVFDMPEAVRFYCGVLGFAMESRSPTFAIENGEDLFHWCMLKAGESRLMLNTAYDEGERPPIRPSQVDDRFSISLYFACPDLSLAYERLQAAGVACAPPRRVLYGSTDAFRALSVRDPDGHRITLQWPDDHPGRWPDRG